jgi:glycosyltransferase involved in cell wall biosynthesis
MKLVASMLARNELGRYLEPCVLTLLEYCDEIRILDDGSTDGSVDWLRRLPNVQVLEQDGPPAFEHEGRARNRLLDWTLEADPDYVLAIDADEFVDDGQALREFLDETPAPVVTLCMEEVWKAVEVGYNVRCDGGWCPHEVPVVWKPSRGTDWRILDRPLACGREPAAVRRLWQSRRHAYSDRAILHFGWTKPSERVSRHARYAELDGGKYHASAHLKSILWPDSRMLFESRPKPAFGRYREAVRAAKS